MSSEYNPLVWRDDDAQFAVNLTHLSYCTAEFSKDVAQRSTDPTVLSMARENAAEHEKIYRKLRQMGKAVNFEFPKKEYLQSCPEAEKAKSLEGVELQKSYMAYLRHNTDDAVRQIDEALGRQQKPWNYGLQKLIKKERPELLKIQEQLRD